MTLAELEAKLRDILFEAGKSTLLWEEVADLLNSLSEELVEINAGDSDAE